MTERLLHDKGEPVKKVKLFTLPEKNGEVRSVLFVAAMIFFISGVLTFFGLQDKQYSIIGIVALVGGIITAFNLVVLAMITRILTDIELNQRATNGFLEQLIEKE